MGAAGAFVNHVFHCLNGTILQNVLKFDGINLFYDINYTIYDVYILTYNK